MSRPAYGEPDPDFDVVVQDGKVWLGAYEETGVEHYGAVEIAFHPYFVITREQAEKILRAFDEVDST